MTKMSTAYIINNLDLDCSTFIIKRCNVSRNDVQSPVQRHPAMASIFRDSASSSTVYGQL